jgi:hypothetical protein
MTPILMFNREHLKRNHICKNCGTFFARPDELEAHNCSSNTDRLNDLTLVLRDALSSRGKPQGASPEARWFRLYEIMFPDSQIPSSPCECFFDPVKIPTNLTFLDRGDVVLSVRMPISTDFRMFVRYISPDIFNFIEYLLRIFEASPNQMDLIPPNLTAGLDTDRQDSINAYPEHLSSPFPYPSEGFSPHHVILSSLVNEWYRNIQQLPMILDRSHNTSFASNNFENSLSAMASNPFVSTFTSSIPHTSSYEPHHEGPSNDHSHTMSDHYGVHNATTVPNHELNTDQLGILSMTPPDHTGHAPQPSSWNQIPPHPLTDVESELQMALGSHDRGHYLDDGENFVLHELDTSQSLEGLMEQLERDLEQKGDEVGVYRVPRLGIRRLE